MEGDNYRDSDSDIREDCDTDPPLHVNCGLCSIPLSMHLHVGSETEPKLLKVRPTISVLACNHCFHSACLEEVTTMQQWDNPDCPVFGGSPKLCAESQEERILNIQRVAIARHISQEKKALIVAAAQVPATPNAQKVAATPEGDEKQEVLTAQAASSSAEESMNRMTSTTAAKIKAKEERGAKQSRTRSKSDKRSVFKRIKEGASKAKSWRC